MRYPETNDEFPTAEEVLVYLQLYVGEFGLRLHLILSTEVLSVSRGNNDRWCLPSGIQGNGSTGGWNDAIRVATLKAFADDIGLSSDAINIWLADGSN